ncbi:MAG: hypothetical protein ACE5GC_03540 [Acidimicrobiia bacterium]
MGTPAHLKAALQRLEARRIHLERQIVVELEQRFFTGPQRKPKSIIASHDNGGVTGANIDHAADATRNGGHNTVVWYEAD